MRRRALALAAVAVAAALPAHAAGRTAPASPAAQAPASVNRPAALIERNDGQYAAAINYAARTAAGAVAFGPRGVTVTTPTKAGTTTRTLAFVGAATPTLTGLDRQKAYVNHLRGNDRSRWRTGVPTFGAVRYAGLWPGVTLDLWPTASGTLAARWTLAPAAEPRRIAWTGDVLPTRWTSAGRTLTTMTRAGSRAFVDARGARVIESANAQRADDAEAASNDGNAAVAWSVFATEAPTSRPYHWMRPSLAVDASGASYLAGSDASPWTTVGGVPVTAAEASENGPHAPGLDLYAAKLGADGAPAWTTYFGGSSVDKLGHSGVAVTPDGRVAFAAGTHSADFPVVRGEGAAHSTHDNTRTGRYEAVAGALTRDGRAFHFSTYLPSPDWTAARAVAVAPGGRVIVGGSTEGGLRATPGALAAHGGVGWGAFVASFASTGRREWIARLGPLRAVSEAEKGRGAYDSAFFRALAVDAAGRAHVALEANTPHLPTTPGAAQPAQAGGKGADAYLAQVSADGRRLVAATFVGGPGDDWPRALVLGPEGPTLVGQTSGAMPGVRADGRPCAEGGDFDAFAARLRPDLTGIGWTVCEGGTGLDSVAYGAARGRDGTVYLTGDTSGAGFRWRREAQPYGGGLGDAFVLALDRAGAVRLATPLGGIGNEYGGGVAAHPGGGVVVSGQTASPDFPGAPVVRAEQPLPFMALVAFATRLTGA